MYMSIVTIVLSKSLKERKQENSLKCRNFCFYSFFSLFLEALCSSQLKSCAHLLLCQFSVYEACGHIVWCCLVFLHLQTLQPSS